MTDSNPQALATAREIPQTQVPFSLEKLSEVLADRAAGNWPPSARKLDTRLALELKRPEWIGFLMAPSGMLEPTLAKTGNHGRTYTSKPNVQGFTRPLRPIISAPGKLILRVDYGASHLRILAHRSGDPTLLADCAAGDPYAVPTAVLVELGVPEAGARKVAKDLMLSILNGMGHKRVGTEIEAAGAAADQGQAFLSRVDEHWPVVAEWIANLKTEVVEAGWKIPRPGTTDITIPASDREEYRIPAYYLQGHEAAALDRVIQAIPDLQETFPSLDLIMPLHDETVWAVAPSEAREAAQVISGLMVAELFGEPIGPGDTDATLDPTMREKATKVADLTDEALAAMAAEVEAVPQTLTRKEHIEKAIANLVLVGERDEDAMALIAQNKTARFQLLLAQVHSPSLVEAELGAIALTPGGRDRAKAIKDIIKPAKKIKEWLDRISKQTHTPFEEGEALIHRVPEALQRVVARLKTDAHGTPRPTQTNLREVVRTDPKYAGRIWRSAIDGNTYIGINRLSGPTAEQELRRYAADTYDLDMYSSACHEAIEEEATHNPRNPLVEMLDDYAAHAEGDESILDEWLGKAFPHATDTPLVRAYARKFILGMVGRAYTPGLKFDTCLTLVGKQGGLKSTFVKTLAGTYLDNEPLSGESHLDFSSDKKNVLELIAGAWVYELAEAEKYGAKEQGRIKNFLSVQIDEYRAAYARRAHRTPRMTVFIATTNTAQFLTDPTGDRRYWVMSTGGLADLEWLRANRQELLGTAARYYAAHKGEKFLTYLTPEEDKQRMETNREEYTEQSPLVEHLISVFKGSRTLNYNSFTRLELLPHLDLAPTDAQAKWPLKNALKQLGFEQRKNAVKHEGARKRTYQLSPDSPYYAEITGGQSIAGFIERTKKTPTVAEKPATQADLPAILETPIYKENADALAHAYKLETCDPEGPESPDQLADRSGTEQVGDEGAEEVVEVTANVITLPNGKTFTRQKARVTAGRRRSLRSLPKSEDN